MPYEPPARNDPIGIWIEEQMVRLGSAVLALWRWLYPPRCDYCNRRLGEPWRHSPWKVCANCVLINAGYPPTFLPGRKSGRWRKH